MRAPVGIERAEQPRRRDHLAERPKRAHGALLGNEEARIDLRCRIVQGHDQVPPLPGNPLVAGAVLVQHHPGHRPPWALAPVRPPPRRRPDPPVRLQGQTKPVVAQPKTMLGDQLLVEMLGREVPVARLEQLQNPGHRVHRRPPRRDPPKAPVVQPLGPLGLVAVPPAPERPLRNAQNLRRLDLAQVTPITASINILELHSISVPVTAPSGASKFPLFGGILKPDRSSVT